MLEFGTYLRVRSVWSDHCGRRIVTSEGVAVASYVLFFGGLSGAVSSCFRHVCTLVRTELIFTEN